MTKSAQLPHATSQRTPSSHRPRPARKGALVRGLLAAGALSFGLPPQSAQACGCFTPPDPANPIVQAGERILFAVDGTTVTATIQIQYAGSAKDFGWLLPLPSVPTLAVSSDEVFTALAAGTAPTYHVTEHWPQNCAYPAPGGGGGGFGGSADLGAAPDLGANGGPSNPLVVQDSVGPYDYAVLKADDKTAMLGWLATNHYFVPTGTDTAVNNYIHPGAYFLALRLRSDKSSGDLQPVVVTYKSDLPMIPIVLTSVTAQANMGVYVWVLGASRAIPRNYRHVVLDDAALLWPYTNFGGGFGGGAPNVPGGLPSNYYDLVGRAVREAPDHHAFVTEYAQKTSAAKATMFPPTRFGDLAKLKTLTAASDYLNYLLQNGYVFSSGLVNILAKYIPEPPGLVDFQNKPVSPANYYYNFDFWYRNRPQVFQGVNLTFDAVALTAEIEKTVVAPVRSAAKLFDQYAYFTRLYTQLDPADMTADPVFSQNPDLPDVSNLHEATLDISCPDPNTYAFDGVLTTESGLVERYPGLQPPMWSPPLPGALRIETLREAGGPVVDTDQRGAIAARLGVLADAGVPGGGGADAGATVSDAGANTGDGGHTTFSGGGGGCSLERGAEGRRGAGGALAALSALVSMVLVGRSRRRRAG